MQKKLIALGTFFAVAFAFATPAKAADGILVLGTQSEVADILGGSGIVPIYQTESSNDLVAVRITRDSVAVYEGGAVEKIVKFVGHTVHGGVVFTLKAGHELWDVLNGVAHTTVHVGKKAFHAVVHVVSHTAHLVVDGATWTVHTSASLLRWVADFVRSFFP